MEILLSMKIPILKSPLPDWALLCIVVVAFCAGIGASAIFLFPRTDSDTNTDCLVHYPLLRPDLDCNSADEEYSRVERIQEAILPYIEEQKAGGQITRASVFFRDLRSRRYASINPEETYVSGSLLKLPLAIAYYKLAEIEPSILDQSFQYQPSAESLNTIGEWKPGHELTPGKTYTVEDMIAQMIEHSDNETAVQLEKNLDPLFFKKVLSDLGISIPAQGDNTQDFLSIGSYSSMLRMLYLSSYLNIDHSQQLLEYLTRSSFSVGLTAGVPKEIPIAHKFGEREILDKESHEEVSAQLHDCGIIYKPNHPYVLCVMTEGNSHEKLPKIIARISEIVYSLE
jgi:beta-lactamase class A